MPEDKHQVGYYREAKKVVVRGLVADVPFGVEVDAVNRTAVFLEDTAMKAPSPQSAKVINTAKDKDCPGCKSAILKLVKGGWGWAKDALGLDQVPDGIAAVRKATCLRCPTNCYDFGVCRDDWPDRPDAEQGCGCILSLKVLQASEVCPPKHWEAHAG